MDILHYTVVRSPSLPLPANGVVNSVDEDIIWPNILQAHQHQREHAASIRVGEIEGEITNEL